MNTRIIICLVLGLSPVVARGSEDLNVEEKETIHRTFPAVKSIDLDNFDGSITVAGADAREIDIEIHKTIRARSPEKVQEAKRDVQLNMSPHDQDLRLYVDGPFRCKCGDGSVNYRGSHFYGYEVRFDFIVKAPRETNLRLRTVNHGDIRVENTSGNFDVDNINGGLELLDVSGSGHAYALNRPVKVRFARNPAAASDFG